MKRFETFALLLVLAACGACAETPDGWSTNFPATLLQGKSRQQPVLVYFSASWCGPCKLMAQTTLTNESVLKILAGLAHVALDVDEHADIAGQHGVSAIPTFKMLTTEGEEVASATGYQAAGDFIPWLTNSMARVAEAAAQQKRFEETLAAADQLLSGNNPESIRKAAAELFDLCAGTGSAIPAAAAVRLKAIAARDPAILLDGLNHPRLAARIQIANILHEKLGDAFDVDPWSDAAARQKSILQWREKLAAR